MAQPLKNPPRRAVTHVLPSVKCSSCGKPVPLDDLGDHICAPSPVLSAAARPPLQSPKSAAALLPARLQNLANAPPSIPRSPAPILTPSNRVSPKPQDRPSHFPSALNLAPPNAGPGARNAMEDRARSPLSRSDHDKVPSHPRPIPTQERARTPSAPHRDFRPDRREMDRPVHPQSQSTPTSSPLRSYVQSNPDPPPSRVMATSPRPSNVRPPPPPSMPPISIENGIDTKTGGEAGMAGVGRRGFQAAALAAMNAAAFYGQPSPTMDYNSPPSIGGRRADAPRYLDIDAARDVATPPLSPNTNSSPSHSSGPISPHAQSIHHDRNKVASRSPSPSQHPHAERNVISASRIPPTFPPDIPKTPETPLSTALSAKLPFFEKYKNKLPGGNIDLRSPQTAAPPSATGPPAASPRLSDPRRAIGPESRNPTPRPNAARQGESRSPDHQRNETVGTTFSESSELGLAYAETTDRSDDGKQSIKSRQKKSPPPPLNLPDIPGHVKFPTLPQKGMDSPSLPEASDRIDRRRPNDGENKMNALSTAPSAFPENKVQLYSAKPVEGKERILSGSSLKSRATSSVYSKSTGTGSGGLSKTMETLLEDIAKEVGPSSALGGEGVTPGAGLTKSKSASALASTTANLPASKAQRSHTVSSPDSTSHKIHGRNAAGSSFRTDSGSSRARDSSDDQSVRSSRDRGLGGNERKEAEKKRICVRCETPLMDKRFVQMDGGTVLCERCWKYMYLPKCRRCNLPIEKQAVSSSDGQLKGKYHRDCFNCNKCHKPFPDKTFYVFDGKPLCAYHYHEANDSLCAASSCGQPIEGPCAVSHAGDRYHPEHFLCEYPKCHERLEEYWEIDGRMLCERHANAATRGDQPDSEDEQHSWTPNAKATKRVTRFIDLAGNGLR